MGLIRTLLAALAYPKAQAFTHTDEMGVRSLVAWLENVKIRHYPVEERKALGDINGDGWPAAFAKYVADLECPIPLEPASRQAVLEWVLSFAVSLEYSDGAEQYAATASELDRHRKAAAQSEIVQQGVAQQQQKQQKQQQKQQKGQQPFPDLGGAEVQQQLAALLKLLRVDTSSGSLAEHVQAAKEVLRDSVLPSLTDASVQHTVAAGNIRGVPLGFETGDPQIDSLATVLRMLYIKDLRGLQTAIDRMVVEVQEYTANPKTDAALGKVGR